jgi:succinoglycan biosynthesis protein ExoM
MLVSICIITYQRPEGLQQLLDRIECLEFKTIDPPTIEVVVVDNDLNGSACEFCDRLQPNYKWPLRCELESRKGVSYARNHVIAATSQAAEFIVMIDDDEFPAAQWLEQLLLAQQKYQADIVTGPVLPVFADKNIPNWLKEGDFCQLKRYETGHRMPVAYTNNVLVRSEIFQKIGQPFDERFALTGGEDSDLFMRLYQAGYQIVWADEAIVYESIPKSRTTIRYILERSYRSWSIQSLLERKFDPSLKTQSIRMLKGIILILTGILLLIPSLFQGKLALVKALRYVWRGCGTIAGLSGRLQEWV